METARPKILVVDDNYENLHSLKSLLSKVLPQGEVSTARTPEVLHLTRREDPDVILFDIETARMDDYKTCKKIKKSNDLQTFPLIFLTDGQTTPEARLHAANAGADGFLSRPFDEIEMSVQIRTWAKLKQHLNRESKDISRLKDTLRRTEKHLALILESVPVVIWQKDIEGRYQEVNREFCEVTGFDKSFILGKRDEELFPRNIADKFTHNDRRVYETGLLLKEIEEFYLQRSGKPGWALSLKIPSFDDKGCMRGLIGFAMDITERMETFKELQRTNAFLDSIVENTPTMILIKDARDLKFIRLNRAGENLLGYSRSQLLGKTDHDIFTQKQADCLIRKDRQVIEMKTLLEIPDEPVQSRQNGIRILHTRKVPIFNEQGEPEYILGISDDITERKRAEAALRESEARNRAILNAMPDMMFVFNRHGVFLDYHSSDDSGLAMSRDSFLGRNVYEVLPENVARATLSHIHDILLERKTPTFCYELEVSGETRFYESRMVACEEDKVLAIVRDITERKLNERERKQLQAQLIHAQKMESVGRLAGGVAHDFNNMLSVILGHSEIAMTRVASDSPLIQCLEAIQSAAKRSADLTRQLLAFARKQTIAPMVLNLNGTIENMLKVLRRLIGENIDLVWRPGGNPWKVKMDPSQVDQVLANLVLNARDAIDGAGKIIMETGSVNLDDEHCKINREASPGDYVLLQVSDTGCGMNREVLKKIFEPFFTTKEMGHGTGLGMSTVYGIIKQNKGFINIYSEPGQGTTCKIYLPRHKEKTEWEPDVDDEKHATRNNETILIVEDEPSILKMAAMMLENQGYRVLTAGGPGEAIELAQKNPENIQLLVTDVVMPDLSGWELGKQLLQLNGDLKILYMSGYTADVIGPQGILREGVLFIQKPFTMSDLIQKVQKALGK